MPTLAMSPVPWLQFIDPNGIPFVAGKLYVYEAGTSTLATIYQDAQGTESENPIILDSFGMCALYIDASRAYKYELTDRFDQPVRSQDNVFAGQSVAILPLARRNELLLP